MDKRVRLLTPAQWRLYVSYLLIARTYGRWRGYLIDDMDTAYSTRDIAKITGIPKSTISRSDAVLLDAGLLVRNSRGWLKVDNFSKLQDKQNPPETRPPIPDPHPSNGNGHTSPARAEIRRKINGLRSSAPTPGPRPLAPETEVS